METGSSSQDGELAENAEEVAVEPAPVAEQPVPAADDEPPTLSDEGAAAEAPPVEEVVVAGFTTRRSRIARWTFLIYDLVWLGLAGVLVYYLLGLPAGTATYEAPLYEPLLWAAIGMLGLGVLLVPVVWLVARARTAERTGLFASVALTGAFAILIGAALWWGALVVVDYVRLGRVY